MISTYMDMYMQIETELLHDKVQSVQLKNYKQNNHVVWDQAIDKNLWFCSPDLLYDQAITVLC